MRFRWIRYIRVTLAEISVYECSIAKFTSAYLQKCHIAVFEKKSRNSATPPMSRSETMNTAQTVGLASR